MPLFLAILAGSMRFPLRVRRLTARPDDPDADGWDDDDDDDLEEDEEEEDEDEDEEPEWYVDGRLSGLTWPLTGS